ncbi:MAG: hypothetical protein KatS3mg060_1752 [Dehalococcoidia bacterium]|nr:MAG: hypothetical protein KatS3mg060_1752 [Dehalococcoidia bacterium]
MTKEARANLNRILIATALLITLAAIVQELLKPKEQRGWHGKALGVVPYDFRPPTFERLRRSFWNPNDPRVLTPRAVGVGWSVNIPALAHVIRSNGLMKRG